MIYEWKTIKTDYKAREALKRGIDQVAEIISSTLGNAGKNVIIERKGLGWGKTGAPIIINDGFATAQQIVLKDEIENLGAQSLIDVAVKTNEMVGDGTTTSVVLAHAIIDKIYKKLQEEKLLLKRGNAINYYKQITESCKNVIAKLKEMSRPIKTKKDIENVAIVSLENEELGKVVAEMIDKVGKDGFINIEDGFGTKIRTEVISGMKFIGHYLDERLATNNRKEAIIKEPLILVYNGQIENIATLKEICDWLLKNQKRDLTIICEGYAKEVAPFVVLNALQRIFMCLAIKAPSLTTEQFEDVAVYTGAKFFDKNQEMELTHLEFSDFGRAEKIIVSKDDVFIVKGKGKPELIKERIEKLKEQKEIEKVSMFKKKIEQRIASLANGVGLIEVTANTEGEQEYSRGKIEDAVLACKAALEEGIVKGGGLALKEINDQLPENDILKGTLDAPYEKIRENSGEEGKIPENIIDPTKVVRIALENACSFAGVFANTNSAIAWHKSKLSDELGNMLIEKSKEREI